MRTKNAATPLALVLVLVAVTAAGCTGNEQVGENDTTEPSPTESDENTSGTASDREATLELQGDSGTEFSGSCTVGDQEPEELSGQVPQSYSFELKGKPLDCEISSDGDMQVTLTVGKNVHSVQRISGGTLHLTYENGSISSVVSSSSGTSREESSSSSRASTAKETSNVTSESRDVSGFNEVELQGVGNLSIEQTGSESLSVEAEEDVLPKIRTDVENNRLVIGPKPNTTLSSTEPINYRLTVKDLNALKVSGSGEVDAEDISTDQLAVTLSGAGRINASGSADSQDIVISGSGEYQAEDLQSKEVEIAVRGSGSATVNVSDELDAKVSGSGSVEYVGNPTVNKDVSGSGEVRSA